LAEAPARHCEGFKEELGTAPALPRASAKPVESIQAEILNFNTKCWGGWHVHLGPHEKHVCDLNSWPFPAAVMGFLGLDQKSGKENAEEHRGAGRASFSYFGEGGVALA